MFMTPAIGKITIGRSAAIAQGMGCATHQQIVAANVASAIRPS